MNTIVLLIRRAEGWSPAAWLLERGGMQKDDGQTILTTARGWISVILDEGILNDFDDEERTLLLKLIDNPVPYLVDWKGDGILDEFLSAAPSSSVVDNDHGLVAPVADVKDRPVKSWQDATSL